MLVERMRSWAFLGMSAFALACDSAYPQGIWRSSGTDFRRCIRIARGKLQRLVPWPHWLVPEIPLSPAYSDRRLHPVPWFFPRLLPFVGWRCARWQPYRSSCREKRTPGPRTPAVSRSISKDGCPNSTHAPQLPVPRTGAGSWHCPQSKGQPRKSRDRLRVSLVPVRAPG